MKSPIMTAVQKLKLTEQDPRLEKIGQKLSRNL